MRIANVARVRQSVPEALGIALTVAASLPACSSADSADPSDLSISSTTAALGSSLCSGGIDGAISCQHDPLVVPYAAGLTQAGSKGILSFVLASADPAPPAVGLNNWTVAVLDASGTAQAATFVEVKPWMPYHGHGPSLVPTISAGPDGSYVVSNLDFFMVGVWQVTVSVQTAAGNDSAVFSFCVGE